VPGFVALCFERAMVFALDLRAFAHLESEAKCRLLRELEHAFQAAVRAAGGCNRRQNSRLDFRRPSIPERSRQGFGIAVENEVRPQQTRGRLSKAPTQLKEPLGLGSGGAPPVSAALRGMLEVLQNAHCRRSDRFRIQQRGAESRTQCLQGALWQLALKLLNQGRQSRIRQQHEARQLSAIPTTEGQGQSGVERPLTELPHNPLKYTFRRSEYVLDVGYRLVRRLDCR
jgi:hypothetical protein